MSRFRKSGGSDFVPVIEYSRCWAKTTEAGKPGMSVLDHCRVVGRVAEALLQYLPDNVVRRLGANPVLAAALHDVGKVSPGFQLKYFRDALASIGHPLARRYENDFETDHARTGASAVWHYVGPGYTLPSLAHITAIHHGSIRKVPLPNDTGEIFGGAGWGNERKRLIEKLVKLYGPIDRSSLTASPLNCLAGLVTISDWVGSDEDLFPPKSIQSEEALSNAAKSAVERCGLCSPCVREGLSFETIFDRVPYPLQHCFAGSVSSPGLYVLEAPMGMGKTEAALYAAYKLISGGHNNGLFFGLPTRLTSDRIHERVERFLAMIDPDFPDVRLAHGNAWLKAFTAGAEAFAPGNPWFNPRKRALLHPFVVGTVDQALMSVLRVRHYFVRSFALAGKVVILDEIHSYDSYTGTLLDEMVRDLLDLGCTVIILTATLTVGRRQLLFADGASAPVRDDYPLVSREVNGRVQAFATRPPAALCFHVECGKFSDHDVAERVLAKARSGHCVLAIANSVAKAQTWFSIISEVKRQGEFDIGLLHSKFPAFRRRRIEDSWMRRLGKPAPDQERPNGCVLVATQVVEQSVDIDADFLITELAPTDMLLQRMGRQWRHTRGDRPSEKPEVVVVAGAPTRDAASGEEIIQELGKVNSLVYSPYVLWRTYCVWNERRKIVLPNDIRSLLEATYRPLKDEPMAIQQLRELFEEQREKLIKIAKANRANIRGLPTGEDKEGVSTRYSDLPTIQVLLARSVDRMGEQADIQLLDGRNVRVDAWTEDVKVTAALYENLVTLASHIIEKIGDCKTPPYLQKHFFDRTPILIKNENGELQMDGRATGLVYTEALGVVREIPETLPLRPRSDFCSDYDDIDVFDKSRFDW